MTTTTTTLLDEARGLLDDTVDAPPPHPSPPGDRPHPAAHPADGAGGARRPRPRRSRTGPEDDLGRRHARAAAGRGPTMLLRADMDALPLQEDTGPGLRLRGRRRHARLRPRHARRHAGRRRAPAGARRDHAAPAASCSCSSPARRAITAPGSCSRRASSTASTPDAAFGLHVGADTPAGVIATRAGADARLRRHVPDHGARRRRSRLGAPRLPRPDPDRLRDRPGVPDAGHPPRETSSIPPSSPWRRSRPAPRATSSPRPRACSAPSARCRRRPATACWRGSSASPKASPPPTGPRSR